MDDAGSGRRLAVWAPLAAVAVGFAVGHRLLPPGHAAVGVWVNLRAVLTAWPFWGALPAAGLLVWFAPRALRRGIPGLGRAAPAALGRALTPLWVGLVAACAGLVVEPLFFRCSLPASLFVGTVSGALAVLWRLGSMLEERGPALRAHHLFLVTSLALLPLVPGWPQVQGDEPHYLLVAGSLVADHDLDLAEDYAKGTFRGYHPAPLSPHYKPGLVDGSRYSMHGIGYPLALVGPWLLAASFETSMVVPLARLAQVFGFALFAALLYVTLKCSIGSRAALFGAAATCWLSPFVFAPLYLFPETLVMTCGLAGFYLAGETRLRRYAGWPLALLPWLAVKTIPLAGFLALGLAWRERAPSWRRALALAAPLVVSLLLHATFTWWLYGSLSPSALYLGADPGLGRQPGYGADLAAYVADWPGALRTFVGYWLDQKEGLLFTGPHWLLAAAGLPWLWRHRRRDSLLLTGALLAYVLPYALSQQIGGQSPPARPLMAVSWILAWPLGVGLAVLARPVVAAVRGLLLVASAGITLVFMADPRLLPHDYPVTRSWLIRSLSPLGFDLTDWFPLWLNVRGSWPWAVALFWLVALGGLAWVCLRGAGPLPRSPSRPQRVSWAAATVGAILVGAVGLWSARLVVTERHRGADLGGGVRMWVIDSLPQTGWAEEGGVWVSGGAVREVLVTATPPLERAGLALRTLQPQSVRLALPEGERALDVGRRMEHIDWGPPAGFPWGRGSALLLGVRAESSASPADVLGGADHRRLAVLLRLQREPR